ncbi:MAG: hypothetical protein CVV56_01210 [Tenericutes bacterium HGW-Tenericutes-1]|nr:MAG: hypothetical protein CVV56_01210 [Tenericutes bacterium HGW-Tenericutes-1]
MDKYYQITKNDYLDEMISSVTLENSSVRFLFDRKYSQLCGSAEVYDYISKFNKYNYDNQKIFVSDEDVRFLVSLKNYSNNHLLNSYLCTLISLNDNEKNKFIFYDEISSICLEIIDSYTISKNFNSYNFFKHFVRSSLYMFHKGQVKLLYNTILAKLSVLSIYNIYYVSSINFMLKIASENTVISTNKLLEYSSIYISKINEITYDNQHFMEKIIYIVEFHISNNQNTLKKELKLKLAHFIFNNISLYSFTEKQLILKKCIELLSEVDDPNNEINKYHVELQKANEESLKNLEKIQTPYSKKLTDVLNKQRIDIFASFEKKNNVRRLLVLAVDDDLIKRDDLYNLSDTFGKELVFNCGKKYILNRDGSIINNYLNSEKKNEFYFNLSYLFNNILDLEFRNLLDAFLFYFSYDESIDVFINDILMNNPICEKERISYLNKYIKGILNRDIDNNIRSLISELENGLKYFFKNQNLPITNLKNRNIYSINLNNILKDDEKNVWRKCLSEFIDGDYLFLLEYLLVSPGGGNIRNDVMHGNVPPDEMNSYMYWYLFFLIIRLYIGFKGCVT